MYRGMGPGRPRNFERASCRIAEDCASSAHTHMGFLKNVSYMVPNKQFQNPVVVPAYPYRIPQVPFRSPPYLLMTGLSLDLQKHAGTCQSASVLVKKVLYLWILGSHSELLPRWMCHPVATFSSLLPVRADRIDSTCETSPVL